MASVGPASERWLFGPLPDLLLGCGGLYACVLVAFAIGGPDLRGAEAAWLGPLLVLLLGAPHYGATLLRVYEQRSDRRAYLIFSLWATLGIAVAFLAGLWSAVVASWLVTIYLTWSPWHYTGQNYGLAVLFLRRRGVAVTGAAKRLLYGSFLLSFALTFVIFHGDSASTPSPEFASGPRSLFMPLGIPAAVTDALFPLILAVYLASLAGAGWLLTRKSSVRDIFPAAVMVASQALWFTIPVVLRHWRVSVGVDPLRWELRDYYFFWIALGHATQYLWITTYYARKSSGWNGYSRYLGKTLLAGTAIWTLPVILLDPNRVGVLPNSTSLALLVASAVNLHHFVLDGAIWKLRQGRIANVLIRRSESADREPGAAVSGGGWQRRTVWAVAAAGCVLALFKYVHQDVLFPQTIAKRDFAGAQAVLDRLDWVSQVSEEARADVDRAVEHERRLRAEYDRRLQRRMGLIPDASAQMQRAERLVERGEWREAARAYEAGLEIDPTNASLLRGAGAAWLALNEPERAIAHLERAVELHPWDRTSREALERARTAREPPPR